MRDEPKQYRATDGELYVVDEIVQKDSDPWVYYTKIRTGDQYNCRLEAFVERFKEQTR